MSFNFVVWKWADAYDSSSKRRKLGVKVDDVLAAFARDGKHAGMADHDFAAFEADVKAKIGPESTDGPYILERARGALTFDLSLRHADRLVPIIGLTARAHGLTSAEL